MAALAALLLALPGSSAAGPADVPAVAVQAVAPTGDGRADVAECSGVLIAPDVVLTAGHCLDRIRTASQVAVFAYDGPTPRPQPLAVVAFARHPGHVVGWRDRPGDPATRQREIAGDLAALRLSVPLAGATPAPLGATEAPPPSGATLSGAGSEGPQPGARSGRMKRMALSDLRISTGDGARVGFATAGATVCGGDSGGPVAIRGAEGAASVWGIAAAILRPKSGCGTRVVVTPVDGGSAGFQTMMATLGRVAR